MEEIRLKPCPFCSGKAIYNTTNNVSDHYCVGFDFEVRCKDCGMVLPGRYKLRFTLSEDGESNILNDERSVAAEKWNKRAGQEGEAE